jgi:hypothetical protein
MCKKAPGIQALFQIEDGDFCFKEIVFTLCEKCNVKDNYGSLYINELNKAEYTWLPRQDQLLEMVTDKKSDQKNCKLWNLFKKYITFILVNSDESVLDLPSWEQLWLAFVMEKKFNKIWNGSDWAIKT